MSERLACSVLCQHRSTQRKRLKDDADEPILTADIIELARLYGRYGYRRIHALLAQAGWDNSLSVVERIWRREGRKIPEYQVSKPDAGSGSTTVTASGCGRTGPAMSGATTSSRT